MNKILISTQKRRNILGWIFILSIVLFLCLNFIDFNANKSSRSEGLLHNTDAFKVDPPPDRNKNPTVMSEAQKKSELQPRNDPSGKLVGQLSMISLITSITSLIGFVSTTYLAWKKEKREDHQAAINLKLKELEIRKLEAEIEKNKSI